MKPNYKEKAKFCYMNYGKFYSLHKTGRHNVELQKMLKQDLIPQIMERKIPKGKNKRVIEIMKDEFGKKIMTEFVTLTLKA